MWLCELFWFSMRCRKAVTHVSLVFPNQDSRCGKKDIVLVGEVKVLNSKPNTLERVHILLDISADRSLMSEDLTGRLQLKDFPSTL